MVFSSLLFLHGFLPIVLLAYFVTPRRYKNATALAASYLFYAWGAPEVVVVLFGSTIADYFIGGQIAKNSGYKRKLLLSASVILNIGLLGYFKYANFFVAEFSAFTGIAVHWTKIALPIGISFFSFQKLSYCIDVYRQSATPAKSFIDFALYVALFPQLIAGPIVRYHDVAEQLKARRESLLLFSDGIARFSLGLAKKVLIADELGAVADLVFSLPASELSTSIAWMGALAYAFQIYFDFSGYSDMAIGLGYMLGFRFLENFNRPYIAESITDFWRRWHISLSQWMKEYLYIPLGGNRVGTLRLYCNLWVVFLLSGLWHGAQWTFIVWGGYHGLLLVLERCWLLRVYQRVPAFARLLWTFLLVLIGWVLFRSADFVQVQYFLSAMFGVGESEALRRLTWGELIGNRQLIVFLVAAALSFFPQRALHWFSKAADGTVMTPVWTVSRAPLAMMLLLLAVITLSNAQFSPFLYFRF